MAPSNALRNKLRAKGLRCTGPRLAVLDLLTRAEGPLTHANVVEALGTDVFDRATLYRNLMDLTEAGLVHRSDHGDHVWRFELADREPRWDQHPHFVCNACGDVVCLPRKAVVVTPQRGAPRSLRQGRVEVQVRGTCDRCK